MINHERRNLIRNLPVAAASGVLIGTMLGHETGASGAQGSAAGARRKVVAGASPNFSRTVEFGQVLYVSGVLGTDPQTRKLVSAEFEAQCRQGLNNIKASVEAGGSNMEQVLKCTCFLVEAGDFDTMNKVYREFFPKDPPARSTVVVKELVLAGAKFEIECIAHV